jgi:hypothetical protein
MPLMLFIDAIFTLTLIIIIFISLLLSLMLLHYAIDSPDAAIS